MSEHGTGGGVLVAAFEPFDGRPRNRAAEAVAHLAGHSAAGRAIELASLPTAFAPLARVLHDLVARGPRVLLLVGESRSARTLLVERVALNIAHARIADNQGARPIDDEVVPGGALARRVTFDPRIPCNAAIAAGTPAEVSSHAGTFCCNAAFYHALGLQEAAGGAPLAAFVHVPERLPWARNRRAARGLLAIATSLVNSLR
jgi:pyroglutamyl-peptidase